MFVTQIDKYGVVCEKSLAVLKYGKVGEQAEPTYMQPAHLQPDHQSTPKAVTRSLIVSWMSCAALIGSQSQRSLAEVS